MALFSIRLQADGSVVVQGTMLGENGDRGHFRTEISKGDEFILPYEELITYCWIETTDAGLFARGAKRRTFDSDDIPDFVRKDYSPDGKG